MDGIIATVLAVFFTITPADKYYEPPRPEPVEVQIPETECVNALVSFFQKHKSPLVDNVDDFIEVSKQYNIDYRFLPAISIIESSGARIEFRKNNPFGWGSIGFSSHSEAIHYVAYHLRNDSAYRGKPLTPNGIGCIYNGGDCKKWIINVDSQMKKLPDWKSCYHQ
jgi:hypothetical protein